jgi:hypothetical protein
MMTMSMKKLMALLVERVGEPIVHMMKMSMKKLMGVLVELVGEPIVHMMGKSMMRKNKTGLMGLLDE